MDLVYSGDTFLNLLAFLHNWSIHTDVAWHMVIRRIRFIGVTMRTKTSPNTWRWQQKANRACMLPFGAVKNVSIDKHLWSYFGDFQGKLTPSNSPDRWGDPALAEPEYSEERLNALSLALNIYQSGKKRAFRREFSGLLSQQPAMKEAWFRQLALDLKR